METPDLPAPSDPEKRVLYLGEEGTIYEVPASEHNRLTERLGQLEAEKGALLQRLQQLDASVTKVIRNKPDGHAPAPQMDAYRTDVQDTNTRIQEEMGLVEDYKARAAAFKAELMKVGRAVGVKWK